MDELAALRPLVRGASSLERFDYWLETFRYMRAMGELRCASARLRTAVAAMRSAPAADRPPTEGRGRARAAARDGPRSPRASWSTSTAPVSTRGELGTVANWQQHVLPRVFEQPGPRDRAGPRSRAAGRRSSRSRATVGPERLVVPADRTALEPGEPLRLEAIVIGRRAGSLGANSRGVRWAPAPGPPLPFELAGRGVWRVSLPLARRRLRVRGGSGVGSRRDPAAFPPAGREAPRTVVVGP